MIKPVLHTIILFFIVVSLKAQENLVYNGSFEEYYSCPVSNDLNNGQLELAKGWWKPTLGSSDYFNRCNTGVVGVPDNFWGHQEAYHGDAYVGFVPISINEIGNFAGSEYVQTKLIKYLKPCYVYHFSMYVSMADYSTHSIGRLGALFSVDTNFINQDNLDIIDIHPQVVNSTGLLGDTVNWIKIEGSFIADGYEIFLTIGYFFNDITNDSTFYQYLPSAPGYFSPYYYVDNISLFEIGETDNSSCTFRINFPNVFTPDNDGINDIISIKQYIPFVKEIIILNRWGNIVTTLTENDPYWNGEGCSDGVYYYIIQFKEHYKKQTGFIHLIR